MGAMKKKNIIFGRLQSVKLGDLKNMVSIKNLIKAKYHGIPVDISSANALRQKLQKKYADNEDVLNTAYVKVGLVGNTLVFRVKHEGDPKFERNVIMNKDMKKSLERYAYKKSDVRLHDAWFKSALSGGLFSKQNWVKDLRKLLKTAESQKQLVKSVKPKGDMNEEKNQKLFYSTKRRHLSSLMTTYQAIMEDANFASVHVQKAERDMGIKLPNLQALLADMTKRAQVKRGKCETLDGLYASQEPGVVTMTDKEFDRDY
ncbi:MAG: hypothetical protein GJ676_06675 [Rhodobacteraceae bacterium]|nr:hypothetical protein [Paracoccaceae bacterium]